MATIGKLSYILGLDTINFRTQLTASERRLRRWRVYAEKDLNYIGRIARNTALGLVGLGAGAAYVANKFIDAADKAEGFKIRLEALTGSQSEANDLFNRMEKYASGVAFEYEEIMGAATAYAGVIQGGNKEIEKWIKMTGDLAAASGINFQEMQGQMVRMYSAGAQAAEMLKERGITEMLGFRSGVSYSAEQTRKQIIAEWKKIDSKFRNLSVNLSKTWSGMMSMMKDAWFIFRKDVMEGGVFDLFKKELQSLLDKIRQAKDDGSYADFVKDVVFWSGAAIHVLKQVGGMFSMLGRMGMEYEKGWEKMYGGMSWTTPFNPMDWGKRLKGGAGAFMNMYKIFVGSQADGKQSWGEFQIWAEKTLSDFNNIKKKFGEEKTGTGAGGGGGLMQKIIWGGERNESFEGYFKREVQRFDFVKWLKDKKAQMPSLIEVEDIKEPVRAIENWRDAWNAAMVDIRAEFYGPESLLKDFQAMGYDIIGSWSNTIEGLMMGTVKFRDFTKRMFLDIAGSFARLGSQMIARKLFESTLGNISFFSGGTSLAGAGGGGVNIGTLVLSGNDSRSVQAIINKNTKRRVY